MSAIYRIQCKASWNMRKMCIDSNKRKYEMKKLLYFSKNIISNRNSDNNNSKYINYNNYKKHNRKRCKVHDHLLDLIINFLNGSSKRIINFNKSHLYNNRNDSPYRRLITYFLSVWSCLSLITTITITSAAPQGCILCDSGDLKGKYHQHNYEEFRYEHQVTRQDAITALRQLNETFYEGSSMDDNSCNSIRCTNKVMKYCFSSQFINDHCLCELAHNVEGLPFVPHICYVGEKAHKPSVGSCFLYEEVKDCCCAPALAIQWRHISMGSKIKVPHFIYLIFLNVYLLL